MSFLPHLLHLIVLKMLFNECPVSFDFFSAHARVLGFLPYFSLLESIFFCYFYSFFWTYFLFLLTCTGVELPTNILITSFDSESVQPTRGE